MWYVAEKDRISKYQLQHWINEYQPGTYLRMKTLEHLYRRINGSQHIYARTCLMCFLFHEISGNDLLDLLR